MIVPGFTVHLPAVQEEKGPGMGGPLSALGILEAVTESLNAMVGSRIDASFLPVVQSRIRGILEHQSAIRSLPGPPKALHSVRAEVDLSNRLTVNYGPDWLSEVDRHLWNRECKRCGSLVTAGFDHTRDECNVALARDVIDS